VTAGLQLGAPGIYPAPAEQPAPDIVSVRLDTAGFAGIAPLGIRALEIVHRLGVLKERGARPVRECLVELGHGKRRPLGARLCEREQRREPVR